jgi:hypothetical protein
MNKINPNDIIKYLEKIGWTKNTEINCKEEVLNDIKEEFGEINNKILNKVLKHFF